VGPRTIDPGAHDPADGHGPGTRVARDGSVTPGSTDTWRPARPARDRRSLVVPDRCEQQQRGHTRLGLHRHTPCRGPYVVAPGDSLWEIAAAHADPGAVPADIAAAWPQWYAANRDVIGLDPDLVLPGTVLAIPEPAATSNPGGTR
jgi:nucleoid-associated protein YgaU